MERRFHFVAFILSLLALPFFTAVHADTVLEPQRTQGLAAPAAIGEHVLVDLIGPGKFVAAQITKQGGGSDLTFVSLDIDGRNVVSASIAALRNWALTQSNPYGLVLLQSAVGLETLTIGYPSTLAYGKSLRLSVNVQESGVVQIIGNVVHGK
ncbi:MAG: hypothetical protein HY308_16605 [Gammaproteobacteria bacterium]|nr:hypothetical protein [Gammaproteobacteria bacterium]